MAMVHALATLRESHLTVEAGSTVETWVAVRSSLDPSAEGFEEFTIRLDGLPTDWYTLSQSTIRVPAGDLVEILVVIHPPHDDRRAPLGVYDFTITVASDTSDEGTVLSGTLVALAPGARTLRSRLLDFLPGVYRSDTFLARFLLIFQSILDPIEQTIDNTHYYFDPQLAPRELLPWLASWLDLELDPGLDEATQRTLLTRAIELARWKGTRRALREELNLRTGGRALIVENFDGLRLGQDASLGLNTYLGVRRDQSIAVTVAMPNGDAVEHQQVEHLVEELKPAHVGHIVRVVAAPSTVRGDGYG